MANHCITDVIIFCTSCFVQAVLYIIFCTSCIISYKQINTEKKLISIYSYFSNFVSIGTPVHALTGTADGKTQKTICEQLTMKTRHIINISPNRKNLRFSVQKYSKSDMHKQLDWLVELVKNVIDKSTGKIPKTIIFCNSLKDIAVVLNYLLLKLGLYAYGRSKKNTHENLIIGIFHSLSWPHCKEQIQQSMKQDGIQTIIVASSALSMGVDFPNIRYVINWGPARSLIEQHQEAGRAGRDGAQSHIVICYHGNLLSKCEDVKNFVKTEDCFRVAAYKPFDKTIAPLKAMLHSAIFLATCNAILLLRDVN